MHYKIPAVKTIEWSYDSRMPVEDSVQIQYDTILITSKRRTLNQLQFSAEPPNRANFALKSGIDNKRPRI